MMRRISIVLLLILATGITTRADVKAGDKPSLKFKDFLTRKTVDVADLHGKIIVVDFWATWCKPCMAEADHLVAVNTKYSGKGLQFIGISLDSEASDLKTTMAAKKFDWPMSFEGSGWDGSIPKAWGITAIPQTFIIGPDGDVLWRGYPNAIDEALESAFKNHPPQLVDPKTMELAKTDLDGVEKALADQQPAKALKQLAAFPQSAKLDEGLASRFTKDSDQLQEFGKTELAAIDPLIQSEQFSTAVAKLRDLSLAFAGTPVANDAKSKLLSLGSDPKVKKALDAEKSEKESTDALTIANKLKADKKDELAYPRFKNIVKLYPGTSAAAEAAGEVKSYEANTAFIARINNKVNGSKAESLLSMANNYQSTGNTELAKKKYQEVIDQFPNTTWSTTAGKAMEAMGN